jgi:hypothetical protein
MQALGGGRRRSAGLRAFAAPHEDALETIRLMGEYVISKLDTDPEHRTSRFRREAVQRSFTG